MRIPRRWKRWFRPRPLVWLAAFGVMAAGCSTQAEDGPAAAGEDDEVEVGTGLVESAVWDESQWENADGVTAPESRHPYANGQSVAWRVQAPGCAQAVRLVFERVELKSGDSLTLYNEAGRRVQRITGTRGRFISNAVDGTTVALTLRANSSGNGFGFKVAAVQMVEGPMPCPRIAWRACEPDHVGIHRDQAQCTCPMPPQCEPLADFDASMVTGGGFTGGNSGWIVRGNGEIVATRKLTAGDVETQAVVGYASLARVRELAAEVQSSRFFLDTPAATVGNWTTSFAAHQGDRSASTSWADANPQPEALRWVVENFNKALTCGVDEGAASCARGYSCVEGRCVEARSCVCPMVYQPQCGVFGTTYSNACAIGCAGEALAHAGECGIEGDTCGTLANLGCADGFECTYEGPDGNPVVTAHHAGETGTCRPVQTACRCDDVDAPVCGVDGRTYPNECDALACHRTEIAHTGACGISGDRCNVAADCLYEQACIDGTCQAAPGCVCPEIYQPVCGTNMVTFGNACEAGCANVAVAHDGMCGANGDTCGTIRGLSCQENLACRYEDGSNLPPYPDAGGVCRPVSWCDAPTDCGRTVRLACPATWYCEQNACRYECNTPVANWETEAATFQSAHPYRNGTRTGWTATGDVGTLAIRFVFSSFDTERDYDFVTLYDEGWTEVARYSGNLGAFVTAEVPGRVAHIVFTSDESVTRAGFVGTSVQYKMP